MAAWLDELLGAYHFEMEYCYDAPAPWRWRVRDRTLDRFHMVTARSGRGTYVIGERTEPFHQGRIIFVSPGVRHSGYADPRRLPHLQTCRFWLCRNDTGQRVDRAPVPFSGACEVRDIDTYMRLWERMHRHYTSGSNRIRASLCSALLTQIVGELALDTSRTTPARSRPIEDVRRFLWRHPAKRLSVAEMARMAGLSRKTFTARFKEILGTSPTDYQIRVRIERARYLLAETPQSVKQIAYRLGYADPYVFSKQFKRFTGCSPRPFRAG
ncbi:MAG: helix-turn-helix domain-containing protein [Kiritimatiellae bacterium]|nr:helix-turn-helix domain-containing protein [Kiritimatiellia bacterium]